MRRFSTPVLLLIPALGVLGPRAAWALDKQAAAHGGQHGVEEGRDFNLSGSVALGASFYNPSYAARPDNSGRALFRYMAHLDVDILGPMLSVPIDVNLFTDRLRKGMRVISPSELDTIVGLSSTHTLGKATSVEIGARVEHDRPVDTASSSQTYVDVRGRLIYSLGEVWPSLKRALMGGDLSGYFTLGAFLYNPSYYARPDNSGLALFRYVGHVDLSFFNGHLGFGVDTNFFSSRDKRNPFTATELDLTCEIIGRYSDFDLHVAYERDMPIDRSGAVQSFAYALIGYNFDMASVLHPAKAAVKATPPAAPVTSPTSPKS